MNPNDKLKQLVKEINSLKIELAKKAREGLMTCLRELFALHPEVKKIYFTAYTPYWNDGEECTYWCNAKYASVNNSDGEDEDEDEIEYPKISQKNH